MKNIKAYEDVINEARYQKELDKDLIISVSANDVKRVNRLLDMGADANSVDNIGMTPLHLAALHGRPVLIRLFLERGARINDASSMSGKTPLHFAVRSPKKGNIESVILLLDRGSEVDPVDREGLTPLGDAVRRTHMMHTPSLSPGEEEGYKEIAKILIQRGADPFKAFKDPDNALKFFDGDIDWMPEGVKAKLRRAKRSRDAFGM